MQRPRCIFNSKHPSVLLHTRDIKGNLSHVLEVRHTFKDLQVQGFNVLTI